MTLDAAIRVPMNDLRRGIIRDSARLQEEFESVLQSGYVVRGSQHAAFQQELADYLGVTNAIGVASGTDALELAIKATMPDGRTSVMTAANAGGYTTTAARRAGFKVVYAEINERSLCVTASTVEAALTEDVGVVIVTHLYGNLTEISGLVTLCHARGVRVIEDCAQAIGARREGRYAGTFADVGTISFYPTKNLAAIGDGGAVVTDDPTFAKTVSQLSQYGWSSKYQIEVAGGMNSRLDELQAAFLRVRLPLLESFNQRRRSIIARYVAAANGTPITVLPAIDESHVGHLAVARSEKRNEVRQTLLAKGVQTDVHFPVPDHWQPGFRSDSPALLVTERVSNEVFSLPCFPELTDAEVDIVCDAIGSLR